MALIFLFGASFWRRHARQLVHALCRDLNEFDTCIVHFQETHLCFDVVSTASAMSSRPARPRRRYRVRTSSVTWTLADEADRANSAESNLSTQAQQTA